MTEDTTREMKGVRRRQKRRTIVVVVVAALALLAIGFGIAETTERADQAETEAALSAANAQLIAEQIHAACERRDEVADQLGDLCQQAEQVADEPAEPVAIAPTDEQLRPLVQQYVEDWLAQHRPRDGRDGETPTVDELAGLIALELQRNPPPAGEDGQDGRTPTAQEIRPIVAEEVAAYLLAHPPPSGPPGPAGQNGADGAPGADSHVPGPTGPPGPACPDGWHQEQREVGIPPETWIVCVEKGE